MKRKRKKQDQGRKGDEEEREEEIEGDAAFRSGERKAMGVFCITIQDAFHCIAVAH